MTNDPGTTGTPGEEPAPGTPPPYQPPAPSYGSDPQPPVYGAPPPQHPPAYGSEPPGAPGAPQYGAAQPPPQYGAPQPPYGAPPPYGAGAPSGYPVPGVTDSKIKTALYLGIGGIVMALCCSPIGIGLGIASVVLATQAEKQGLPGNAQQAKIVGFVAIGVSILATIFGLVQVISAFTGG